MADFEDRLGVWADRDNPAADLRFVVAEWILTRMEDPYEGAQREPGFPDLWSVRIRGTAVGERTAFRAGGRMTTQWYAWQSRR